MLIKMRRFRKWQLLQLMLISLSTSLILLYWEKIDNTVVTHVKSYTYRFFLNNFSFIHSGFRVSPEDSIKFSNYSYILNHERKCEGDVLLLLFVKSSPENFERRQAIRSSWGNETYIERTLGVSVKVLFALGLHHESEQRRQLEKQLVSEDQLYHDLIQQDFIDAFHNLTLKLLLQLGWKENFCHNAQFFMSADDDVFIHTPNLIRLLRETVQSNVEDLWIGRVHRGSPPNRDKESKYYVSRDLYPWLSYPDYTPGSGYILSKSVASKVYRVSITLNASLHIDDVFLGICAKIMHISPRDHAFFSGEGKVPHHHCIFDQMLTSHGHVNDIHELWKRVTSKAAGQKPSGLLWKVYCTAVKLRFLCIPFFSDSYPCKGAFL